MTALRVDACFDSLRKIGSARLRDGSRDLAQSNGSVFQVGFFRGYANDDRDAPVNAGDRRRDLECPHLRELVTNGLSVPGSTREPGRRIIPE